MSNFPDDLEEDEEDDDLGSVRTVWLDDDDDEDDNDSDLSWIDW